MKKLINDPANVVREELQGMEAAHPDLVKVSYDPYYITRADAPVQGKVALISGRRLGHEPMHGGFVGTGMLDAACPGEVFTSPTPDQMEAATKAVDGGAGVVHIVKNYTGDVMNFEMAAELCRSRGHRGRVRPRRRRRRRPGQPVHGRPPRRRRRPCCWRRSPARPPSRSAPLKEVAEIAREVNANAAVDGHGAHVVHGAGRRQAHVRARLTTRSRSASASTASRGASARKLDDGARDRRADGRADRRGPAVRRAATRCSRSSTAWAARP